MKTFRAILIGIVIWFLAVCAFTLSFFIPLMDDFELQANIFFFLSLIPLAWFGARIYYRAEQNTPGLRIALVMLLTGVILDAGVTVPFLVIPAGGSHYQFFTDISFWVIALEYLLVVTLYHKIMVRQVYKIN